jgi:hypothetical protein
MTASTSTANTSTSATSTEGNTMTTQAAKKCTVKKVSFDSSKKTGAVVMNIDIQKIAAAGSVTLTQEGAEDITLDLMDVSPEVMANLLAYGIGRHAPDSLKAADPQHMNNIANYFDLYRQGYISPKAKKKAEAPAPSKSVKAGHVSREAFEAYLQENGAEVVVEALAGFATNEFWVAVTSNAKAADMLATYKAIEADKRKAEAEAAASKASAVLSGLDF